MRRINCTVSDVHSHLHVTLQIAVFPGSLVGTVGKAFDLWKISQRAYNKAL